MKTMKALSLSFVALVVLNMTGCATYRTMSAESEDPKLYGGTRLNVHALSGDDAAAPKPKVDAPRYPLLDLPLSFALDTAIFPMTLSVVTYRALFK
jgi:uncharacterized protein YceK